MKKVLIIILSLVTISAASQRSAPLDTRTLSKCGYVSYNKARAAAYQIPMTADEEMLAIITEQQADGSFCFTIVIVCRIYGTQAIKRYLDNGNNNKYGVLVKCSLTRGTWMQRTVLI